MSTTSNGSAPNGSEPPGDDEAEPTLERTADLLKRLLAVPKSEANGKPSASSRNQDT